jgi:hypothetical protein
LTVMGEDQEAQGWFAAAYEELSRDPKLADEQDRLSRLKELGKIGRQETPGSREQGLEPENHEQM